MMISETSTDRPPGMPWRRPALLSTVVVAAAIGYVRFGDSLTLQGLAARETELRRLQLEHAPIAYGMAFLTYVAVTGLSLPGAAALTLICGWFFGLWRGVVLVSFASTAGATIAFLVSRYLFRDALQSRFGDKLAVFNRSLKQEGPFYLFLLRLIPAVPFFVINVVMGLTPLRTRTFWWVSQLGMLPGTFVYVYAGSAVPSLETLADQGVQGILTPQLMVAFVLLGIVPLGLKMLVSRFRPRPTTAEVMRPISTSENEGSRRAPSDLMSRSPGMTVERDAADPDRPEAGP